MGWVCMHASWLVYVYAWLTGFKRKLSQFMHDWISILFCLLFGWISSFLCQVIWNPYTHFFVHVRMYEPVMWISFPFHSERENFVSGYFKGICLENTFRSFFGKKDFDFLIVPDDSFISFDQNINQFFV